MICDNPRVIVSGNNIDAALALLRKKVSTHKTFKLLKLRKLNPSVQGRRKAKAKLSDVKRRRRHTRKTIRKKT